MRPLALTDDRLARSESDPHDTLNNVLCLPGDTHSKALDSNGPEAKVVTNVITFDTRAWRDVLNGKPAFIENFRRGRQRRII